MALETTQIITSVAASIIGGLVVAFGWSITLGRKMQILDDLRQSVVGLNREMRNLDKRVTNDVRGLDVRLSGVEGRLSSVTRTGSPVELSDIGQAAVSGSGLDRIIDEQQPELMAKLKERKASSAYDIQEASRQLVEEMAFTPEQEQRLKAFAFQQGLTLNEMYIAGAVYLRDIALKELGISV